MLFPSSIYRAAKERLNSRALLPPLVAALLFVEILLYGANATDLALGFSVVWFLSLALILTQGWAQDALSRLRLRGIGVAFAIAVGAGALQLTNVAPGGRNTVWAWVPDADPCATIDPYLTLVEMIKLISLAALFLTGALFAADRKVAMGLVQWISRFGIAYSLWAFYDRYARPDELFGGLRQFDGHRLSASLVSANTAATLFGILFLIYLTILIQRLPRSNFARGLTAARAERLLIGVSLPVVGLTASATCLILTLSRGGLISTVAVAASLVGYSIITRVRRNVFSAPALATGALVAVLILVSFAVNLAPLTQRTDDLSTDSHLRASVFTTHWAAISGAPLSGYGLGGFIHVNSMVMNSNNEAALNLLGALHNVYLQWLEQAGVVGTSPMIICLGMIIYRIISQEIRDGERREFRVSILAILALCLIHGLSDFGLEVPALASMLAIMLGVGSGVSLKPQDAKIPVTSEFGQEPRY